MAGVLSVLVVIKDELNSLQVRKILESKYSKVAIFEAWNKNTFAASLQEKSLDAIIVDSKYTNPDASELLKLRNKYRPHMPFILIAAPDDEDLAEKCLINGADDYLITPYLKKLPFTINSTLEKRHLSVSKMKAEAEKRKALLELARASLHKPAESDKSAQKKVAEDKPKESTISEIFGYDDLQPILTKAVNSFGSSGLVGLRLKLDETSHQFGDCKDPSLKTNVTVNLDKNTKGILELFFNREPGINDIIQSDSLTKFISYNIESLAAARDNKQASGVQLARFRAVLRELPHGLVLFDTDLNFKYVNFAARVIIANKSIEENRNLRSYMNREDYTILTEKLHTMNIGEWYSEEIDFYPDPSSSISRTVKITHVDDSFIEGGGFICLMEEKIPDIGQGNELQAWEQFRTLFNLLPMPILIFDFSGDVVNANSSACDWFNRSSEELKRNNLHDLLSGSDTMRFVHWKRDILRGSTFASRVNVVTEEREQVECIVHGIGIKYYGIDHILIAIRDASLQQKAMQSRSWMYQGFDSVPVAMIITDTEGSITWVNLHFHRIFGHAPTQVNGKAAVHFFTHRQNKDLLWDDIESLARVSHAKELLAKTLDGRTISTYLTVTDIRDDQQEHLGYILVVADQTREETLESEIDALTDEMRNQYQMSELGLLTSGLTANLPLHVDNLLQKLTAQQTSIEDKLNQSPEDIIELYDTLEHSVIAYDETFIIIRDLRDIIDTILNYFQRGMEHREDKCDLVQFMAVESTSLIEKLAGEAGVEVVHTLPKNKIETSVSRYEISFLLYNIFRGIKKSGSDSSERQIEIKVDNSLISHEGWFEIIAKGEIFNDDFVDDIANFAYKTSASRQSVPLIWMDLFHRLLRYNDCKVSVVSNPGKVKIRITIPLTDALEEIEDHNG